MQQYSNTVTICDAENCPIKPAMISGSFCWMFCVLFSMHGQSSLATSFREKMNR